MTVLEMTPKPVPSTGLEAVQRGFAVCVLAVQSGMLMMLRLPGWVPSPWLSTTSWLVVGERSAQTGLGAEVPPV